MYTWKRFASKPSKFERDGFVFKYAEVIQLFNFCQSLVHLQSIISVHYISPSSESFIIVHHLSPSSLHHIGIMTCVDLNVGGHFTQCSVTSSGLSASVTSPGRGGGRLSFMYATIRINLLICWSVDRYEDQSEYWGCWDRRPTRGWH